VPARVIADGCRGFAALENPALCGNSGIVTFVANHDGVVYHKEPGANTIAVARNMKAYGPDQSWSVEK